MINCFTLSYLKYDDEKDPYTYIRKNFDFSKLDEPECNTLDSKCEQFLYNNTKKKQRSANSYWGTGNCFIDAALDLPHSYGSIGGNYANRLCLSFTKAFIKRRSDDKLYTIFSLIDVDETIDNVIASLFKMATTKQEKYLVYSLVFSYYFVINDYKNFEKVAMEAFNYVKENEKSFENINISSFVVPRPQELGYVTVDEYEQGIYLKERIWLANFAISKNLYKDDKSSVFSNNMASIYSTISSQYRNLYTNDKDTLNKFYYINKRYNKKSVVVTYDNAFNIHGSTFSVDKILDIIECSSDRLRDLVEDYGYSDRQRIKELLNDNNRDRFFDIIRTYLIGEYGQKRVNKNLRKFLRQLNSMLRESGHSDDMMDLINELPSNISGEVLKQMVGD